MTDYCFVKAKIAHTGNHPRLGGGQSIPVHLVLRAGYSDFVNDGQFNSTNEEMIVPDYPPGHCPNDITETDTYWNSSSSDYQTSPP